MSTEPAFSNLKARIVEEDGSFTVSIRMYSSSWEQDRAWGEEIAPSIEIASEMISGLAARYAIPQDGITIELVMKKISDGTRHWFETPSLGHPGNCPDRKRNDI